MHKDFEVCLLLDGSLSLLSRGRTFTYKKGDMWVVNPFESHELAASRPALILSLQISPSFFAPVFPQMGKSGVFPGTPGGSPGASLLPPGDRRPAYFQKEGEDAPLRLAGLIFLFFDRLLSSIPQCPPAGEGAADDRHQGAPDSGSSATTSTRTIRRNCSSQDIAGELGLTMSWLSHFFKDAFGMSFQAYLMKIRCEKPQLLLLTDFTLLDISIACGFSDIKYLNKGFGAAVRLALAAAVPAAL